MNLRCPLCDSLGYCGRHELFGEIEFCDHCDGGGYVGLIGWLAQYWWPVAWHFWMLHTKIEFWIARHFGRRGD